MRNVHFTYICYLSDEYSDLKILPTCLSLPSFFRYITTIFGWLWYLTFLGHKLTCPYSNFVQLLVCCRLDLTRHKTTKKNKILPFLGFSRCIDPSNSRFITAENISSASHTVDRKNFNGKNTDEICEKKNILQSHISKYCYNRWLHDTW